ncbi:hypothetical protein H696_03237 [Fonticula alba]|uniref:Uncharacterized protein n=1 Tax=Fonticula alba TaxID=691883 RepID=A0A058Z8C6_FONAL|nr:hypothetical protein H696_03237 [Fonticula alba]KCV69792.1 hypothetical protein H696_03237 [Fonticula alba]|eukprot:XP_009495398.1 hypothetical protein H696_03237 [Fonticula alba]
MLALMVPAGLLAPGSRAATINPVSEYLYSGFESIATSGVPMHSANLLIDTPALGWSVDPDVGDLHFYHQRFDPLASDDPRAGTLFGREYEYMIHSLDPPDQWTALFVESPLEEPIMLAIYAHEVRVFHPSLSQDVPLDRAFEGLAAVYFQDTIHLLLADPTTQDLWVLEISSATSAPSTIGHAHQPGARPAAVAVGHGGFLFASDSLGVAHYDLAFRYRYNLLQDDPTPSDILTMGAVRLNVGPSSDSETLAVFFGSGRVALCFDWRNSMCADQQVLREELPPEVDLTALRILNPPALVSVLSEDHLYLEDGQKQLWRVALQMDLAPGDQLVLTRLELPPSVGPAENVRMLVMDLGAGSPVLRLATEMRVLFDYQTMRCDTDRSIGCMLDGTGGSLPLNWACQEDRVLSPFHPSGELCAGCRDGHTRELSTDGECACAACTRAGPTALARPCPFAGAPLLGL